jgi:hypothetical protein
VLHADTQLGGRLRLERDSQGNHIVFRCRQGVATFRGREAPEAPRCVITVTARRCCSWPEPSRFVDLIPCESNSLKLSSVVLRAAISEPLEQAGHGFGARIDLSLQLFRVQVG